MVFVNFSNFWQKMNIDELIIGKSKNVLELKLLINKVASSESTVLVLGETGTGKELVAEAIHKSSKRRGQFVPVNCAAIPSELLESELFGHEKVHLLGLIKQEQEGLKCLLVVLYF